MSGKHHGGHHHSHRYGGRTAIYAPWVYELECNPNDPFYKECLARFGYDVLTGYADDIKAIHAYFVGTEVKTTEAQKIKDSFLRWYDTLWITWNYVDEADYDLARNQRNHFNLANATTAAEKAQVQEVITSGLTSEQMQGGTDRRLSTGMLPGPEAPPKPPLVPSSYLVGGAVLAGVALIAWAYGEGRG
jgi:hypothetical protein